MNYLCPRIVESNSNHIYFGGNQSWLSRNSAACSGCGPTSAANIFTSYAKNNSTYARDLGLIFHDNKIVTQDSYVALLNHIYKTLKPIELPVLSSIYDRLARNNKFFAKFPPTLGLNLLRYTRVVLRYGLQHNIYLQRRSLATMFCSYTRGLTFIKLALANDFPITMMTSFNTHAITVYDHPHLYNGRDEKMKKHFVTITDIRESKDNTSPDLIVTTWGKPATISYADLYKSWQNIRAIGSGMVYFIPVKNKKIARRSLFTCLKI